MKMLLKNVLIVSLILSFSFIFACKANIISDENLKDSETLLSNQRELFIYPIRGYISSPYGLQSDPVNDKLKFHTGIDLSAGIDTPVKAAMSGIVTGKGNSRIFGNYIIIRHDNSYHTFYANLSDVSINQGDHIMQGSIIGKVGITGCSAVPHLHFGIFKDDKAVDPQTLFGLKK